MCTRYTGLSSSSTIAFPAGETGTIGLLKEALTAGNISRCRPAFPGGVLTGDCDSRTVTWRFTIGDADISGTAAALGQGRGRGRGKGSRSR